MEEELLHPESQSQAMGGCSPSSADAASAHPGGDQSVRQYERQFSFEWFIVISLKSVRLPASSSTVFELARGKKQDDVVLPPRRTLCLPWHRTSGQLYAEHLFADSTLLLRHRQGPAHMTLALVEDATNLLPLNTF